MDTNFIDDNILINSAKEKKMLFILVVDTSLSMKNKINIVNKAIKNNIEKMKQLDLSHNIAKVMITILEFNREAVWIPQNPQEIQNYHFVELQCSENAESQYAHIYQELNQKLTEQAFLKDAKDYYPIILLISDGKPTDIYDDILMICENNEYFHKAMRVALPIITDKNMDEVQYRDSIDYEYIMDFTGQKDERIFSVTHLDDLIDMLEIVTQTAVKRKEDKKKQSDQFHLDDPFNDIRNKILNIR